VEPTKLVVTGAAADAMAVLGSVVAVVVMGVMVATRAAAGLVLAAVRWAGRNALTEERKRRPVSADAAIFIVRRLLCGVMDRRRME
jgi:hypothetical protein